ncbi:uncharacterized protein DDB_G0286299 isoform X2 [Cephus cinctus]|uniref:Uncharacterized protein DDB_G0286299 isoform X2 n=1 Tax=Cephus cinctus TaxID=211228 RepID=A0AAJ7RIT8_CEPCN|nr:uncharacterized protein DDB_G0286299 isoform X2 [Cephus cinctus]
MPPKAPPPKSPPPKGGKDKMNKGKNKGKRKKHRLNLKGFLKTPADWARFDAWAKVNAQPRKQPEPEPIERSAKPLSYFKKRLQVLSKPHKKPDSSINCRLALEVSKAALKAKPSKRIIKMSLFVARVVDYGREFPLQISQAALRYKPSQRILEISQPHKFIPEECKSLEISKNALKHKTTARERRMAIGKKAIECPDQLTDEELDILMTPTGIRRSALNYKFTSWMLLLSLPSYRFLKERSDEDAKTWKKLLVEESESRGKRALEEKKKKLKPEKSKAKQKKASKKSDESPEKEEKVGDQKVENIEEEKKEELKEEQDTEKQVDEENKVIENQDQVEKQENLDTESKKVENTPAEDTKPKVIEHQPKKRRRKNVQKGKGKEEEAKKKKAERNAWRTEPSPCKMEAFRVSKAALKGKVSPRMAELAKPHIHKTDSCRKNPFAVKKGALSAQASGRVIEMAQPTRPRDTVTREPPREKDPYGRPIYPKPPYGKRVLRLKPYVMGKCKDKEEKVEKPKKTKPIDPIAYATTIDPCIDPEGAKRQARARKRVEQMKKTKQSQKTNAKAESNTSNTEDNKAETTVSKTEDNEAET